MASRPTTPKSTPKRAPWINPSKNPSFTDLRSSRGITEQKENRARSPRTSFMSPTVSAESKRKILAERNGDGLHRWESPNFTCKYEAQEQDRQHEEEDSSNQDECSSNGESDILSGPLPAPVEDSVSSPLPPYDPEVNYLSPRPRFLRYRPKPKSELVFSPLELEEDDDDVADDVDDDAEEVDSRPPAKSKSRTWLVVAGFVLIAIAGLIGASWPSLDSIGDRLDLIRGDNFSFFYSMNDNSYPGFAVMKTMEEQNRYHDQIQAYDHDLHRDQKIDQVQSHDHDLGQDQNLDQDQEIDQVQNHDQDLVQDQEIDQVQDQDQIKDQDETQDQELDQVQDQDQDQIKDQDETQDQELDQVQDKDQDQDHDQVDKEGRGDQDQEQDQDQERDLITGSALQSDHREVLIGVVSVVVLGLAGIAVFALRKVKRERVLRKKAEGEGRMDNEKGERDSMASPERSYGSFTAYEKVSVKKEGTVMTPVRRSSRIRSHQMASPS